MAHKKYHITQNGLSNQESAERTQIGWSLEINDPRSRQEIINFVRMIILS